MTTIPESHDAFALDGRNWPQLERRSFVGLLVAFLIALFTRRATFTTSSFRALDRAGSMHGTRMYPLGFDSVGEIQPGESRTVSTQTQEVFKGRRLVVPQSIAPNFVIESIHVGVQSQIASTTALPAEMFLPQSTANIDFDTAGIQTIMTISVTNIDNTPHRFRACLMGYVQRASAREIAREMRESVRISRRKMFSAWRKAA